MKTFSGKVGENLSEGLALLKSEVFAHAEYVFIEIHCGAHETKVGGLCCDVKMQ